MNQTINGFPDFDSEFHAFADAWPILWEVAEHACESARIILAEHSSDPQTTAAAFPDFQRFFARQRLSEKISDTDSFVSIRLSRNGMAFGFKGRHVRWWKKGIEAMPRGGRSQAKIQFLSQHQLALPFLDLSIVVIPNRVVMYEVDSQFHLRRLWFGLPRSASEDGRTEVYWVKPVPFEMIAAFGVAPQRPEEDVDEGDELPYVVLDAEAEGEGGSEGVGA